LRKAATSGEGQLRGDGLAGGVAGRPVGAAFPGFARHLRLLHPERRQHRRVVRRQHALGPNHAQPRNEAVVFQRDALAESLVDRGDVVRQPLRVQGFHDGGRGADGERKRTLFFPTENEAFGKRTARRREHHARRHKDRPPHHRLLLPATPSGYLNGRG
jgi:hypothetical protein